MTTHTVPSDVFDLLACGDGDTLGVLRAGQRSKRLLLLHELMSTTSSRAPRVFAEANAAESFAVVVDAQRHSRHTVDELLLQPHVGAWATSCLRSLLSDGEIRPEDIGHIGAVAASAALRAGQSFEVTTHVRDGSVMFPTFGMARLEPSRGWCRVRSRAGADGVEISAAGRTQAVPFDAPAGREASWLPLRRLRSSAGGVTVDLHLDDLDPFRGCGQLPITARLDAPAVEDWQAKLDEAWPLLVDDHRTRAEAIGAGVASLVPLLPTEAAVELSATCHEAGGAVAMTPPRKSLSLALALVHEFQHTKLSALLDLVPLVDRSPDRLFYAPWRSDPRPLRGLLQGTYAFLGLTGFWEVHRGRRGTRDTTTDDDWAHFELALGRDQVGRALDALRGSGQLREQGIRFVDGMRRRLSQLDRLPIPSVPRSFARLASLDHATSWRLRNLRPDADQVADWANAWLVGRPGPGPGQPTTAVVDGGGTMPSNGRLSLLRQRLAFPARWNEDTGEATPADVLFVAGNLAHAADIYRAQLAHDPDDLTSWAGLALVRRELPTAATWALTTLPESVYALHQAIRARCGTAPDVEQLSGWIANGAR